MVLERFPRYCLPAFILLLSLAVAGTAQHEAGNNPNAASAEIRNLIARYAAAVDAADPNLAAQVWSNTADISFIHPGGHLHGWEEVKTFYEKDMGGPFSERKLNVREVAVHVYGDAAWAEFYWHFTAMARKDGATVQTDGRETQIYRKDRRNRWVLVHVHYSGMPTAE